MVRRERNFFKNIIVSVLIMTIVTMFTIAVLIMVQHPLVMQGGVLHVLLYGAVDEAAHMDAPENPPPYYEILPPDMYELQYIQRFSPLMVQVVPPFVPELPSTADMDSAEFSELSFSIPENACVCMRCQEDIPYCYLEEAERPHTMDTDGTIFSEPSFYTPENACTCMQYYGDMPYLCLEETGDTIFSELPFYIYENTYIYAQFHLDRPYLSPEEVVWKVNAHLHLPFFYYIRVIDEPNPLLVNPFYRLPPGFTPQDMVPVNNANCRLRATSETVAAFHAMRAGARDNGLDLVVVSAFRTARRQAELFSARNYVDGVVARPYHSEHQTGRALDLGGTRGLLDARGPSRTGTWVAENAHLYGFIVRYKAETTHITGYIHEPWHITYVGVGISMYMYENGILSLEEFVGRNPGVGLWDTVP